MKKSSIKRVLIVLVALTSSACTSIRLAGYDQKAYENATTLKAEVTAFVNEGGIECSIDDEKKGALQLKLESAYEYANGVEHNNEAASNWRDQIDTLSESYFVACREQGRISQAFFDDLKMQIRQGFDTIICLEANKREITICEGLTQESDRDG